MIHDIFSLGPQMQMKITRKCEKRSKMGGLTCDQFKWRQTLYRRRTCTHQSVTVVLTDSSHAAAEPENQSLVKPSGRR